MERELYCRWLGMPMRITWPERHDGLRVEPAVVHNLTSEDMQNSLIAQRTLRCATGISDLCVEFEA